MGQLEQEKDAGYLFLDIDSKRQKKTDNYEKKKKFYTHHYLPSHIRPLTKSTYSLVKRQSDAFIDKNVSLWHSLKYQRPIFPTIFVHAVKLRFTIKYGMV